jgi:hypothetical protein
MSKTAATKKATERMVSEIEGKAPTAGLYRFVVSSALGTDGAGYSVEARGPRGEAVATVYGDVDRQSVVGTVFYRN